MAARAAMATKEVLAYRIKAKELLHKPRGPTPLYLDATAVLHGTATEQVSRKIRHLAAKLVIAQETRAHEKVRAVEIDVSLHPADIPTKPLQGRGVRLRAGPDSRTRGRRVATAEGPTGVRDGTGLEAAAQEPAGLAEQPSDLTQKGAATPAGTGMAARYEQLALGPAPGTGHMAPR